MDDQMRQAVQSALAEAGVSPRSETQQNATPAPAAPLIDYDAIGAAAAKAFAAQQSAVAEQAKTQEAQLAQIAASVAQKLGLPTPGSVPPLPVYSPGVAVGAPDGSMERDATKWTADYIAQLRAGGKFREKLDEYRESLPGGSSGLFRRKIPGSIR